MSVVRRIVGTLVLCSFLAFFLAFWLSGCGGGEKAPASLEEKVIELGEEMPFNFTITGHQQSGQVEQKLKSPLRVEVEDSDGNPLEGFRVHLQSIGLEGAKLVCDGERSSRLQLNTDDEGRAQAFVELGKKLGVYKVEILFQDERGNELQRFVCKLTALDYRELFFGLFGGLGLFLFGMMLMTDALQVIAGSRMKRVLEFLTSRRIFALGVGAVVTAIIQSSSATTVMLVGLLNAGLMQFEQAIPIIFGANIGTTITGQLIAFKLSAYALPSIGVAFLLIMFGRNKRQKTYGYALIGFGLLFLGMGTMSGVFKPLRSSPVVAQVFIDFSHNPLLGFLVGIIMTCILQSSSATVGLTIALAGSGILPFAAAVPIIFGDNVGTTITAILASLNVNLAARRAACVHVLFNLLGSGLMLASLFVTNSQGHPIYLALIDGLTAGEVFEGQNVARHVANAHTVFNVLWGFAFLPFVGFFARLAIYLLPSRDEKRRITLLEEHLLENPELALTQSMAEVEEMLSISRRMFVDCMQGVLSSDDSFFAEIQKQEEKVDDLQEAVTDYLIKLSQERIGEKSAKQLPHVLHSVNDVERISDIVVVIMRSVESMFEKDLKLSEEARLEIEKIYGRVLEVFERVLLVVATGDCKIAEEARKVDREVDDLEALAREHHLERLKLGSCEPLAGMVFLDIVCELEKISNRLDNVAQAFTNEENPLPRAH